MKEAGLHVRIDEDLRKRFVEVCQKQDITASQVLRAFMRKFIEDHYAGRQQELFETMASNQSRKI
jgi:antitoxin component of RelBE/YafQ-DinJ toxin-antitoxin module